MTIWTNLPDAALEPGKPIRSIDGLALRNNPVAITEGSSGAPKIQTAAIQDSAVTTAKLANDNVTTAKLAANERMTTSNVLAATAGASAGAVGSYAFAVRSPASSSTTGSVVAGSVLRFANGETISSTNNFPYGISVGPGVGGFLTGSWRCMGNSTIYTTQSYGSAQNAATLWLRIS